MKPEHESLETRKSLITLTLTLLLSGKANILFNILNIVITSNNRIKFEQPVCHFPFSDTEVFKGSNLRHFIWL